MSRAQQLRKKRNSLDPNAAADFMTFDFSPLTEKDPKKAPILLKFGRKGNPHETIIRLSDDKTYVEWKGKFLKRKKKNERRMYLEQVERIQEGQTTFPFERFKKYFGEAESNSFSLICGNGRSLDLCAPTPKVFQIWTRGLSVCLKNCKDIRDNMDVDKRYLMSKFDAADKDKSRSLTKKEVLKLVSSMNINCSEKAVEKIFREVDRDRNLSLDYLEFVQFVELLRRSFELEYIWEKMVCGEFLEDGVTTPFNLKELAKTDAPEKGAPVSLQTFIDFWERVQGERLNEIEAKRMVNDAMNDIFHGQAPVVSFAGLLKIIQSKKNDAYDPAKRILHMDMTHPLSHYFIASSHNTYLEGDQLTSKSSVNRYISDLCKGCRCVELDCWDGDNGEPIIYHGHTLTSKILFKEVIVAIKHYAFKNSPYPIILSIENHCSLDQQEKMADILVEVLSTTRDKTGDMIYKPSRHTPTNLPGNLPSPEDLKFKVLIKGKKLKEGEEDDDDSDEEDDEDDNASTVGGSTRHLNTQNSNRSLDSKADDTDDEDGGVEDRVDVIRKNSASTVMSEGGSSVTDSTSGQGPRALGSGNATNNLSARSLGMSKLKSIKKLGAKKKSGLNREEQQPAATKAKKEKKTLHKKLSDITYLGTFKHKNFKNSMSVPCNLMSSFSEGKTMKYLSKPDILAEWLVHNRYHISRIYPKGTRVDSSNYDPMAAWAAGNHLVALNYQTPGLPMQLNDSLFRQNGSCGYVLKPMYMLKNPAEQQLDELPSAPLALNIHIISGTQLPKVGVGMLNDVTDPFVIVSIHGTPEDQKEYRTKTIKDNGHNPCWDEIFSFTVKKPDTAQLCLRVYDENEISNKQALLIAHSFIPFSCLRSGLRSVELYDEAGYQKGDYDFASLLIRTCIKPVDEAIPLNSLGGIASSHRDHSNGARGQECSVRDDESINSEDNVSIYSASISTKTTGAATVDK